MKLTQKMLFTIAGALVALGIVVISVSIIMVKGDFRLLSSSSPYVEKSYSTQAAGISELILNGSDTKVNIVKSPDDQVHLNYYDRDKEKYTINASDGRLLIDLQRNMKWYDYIGIDFYSGVTFSIAVPDDMACNFSINTTNGKITVDGISEKGNLSFITSNGGVTLSNITMTGSLKSATSNGNVVLSDIKAAGTFVSTTSNGAISAKKVSASGVSVHSSNGKLVLTDLVSDKNIDAETSNDKIQINNISVGTTLKICSSNGDVVGNINDLIRNFNITSHTSNGDNNLPENLSGGTKSLNVETSNGNINVKFSNQ